MRVRHTATGKVYRVVEMRLLPVTGDPAERQPIVVDADELLTPGQDEWLIEAPGELGHDQPPVLAFQRYTAAVDACCDGCGFIRWHAPSCRHAAGLPLRGVAEPCPRA